MNKLIWLALIICGTLILPACDKAVGNAGEPLPAPAPSLSPLPQPWFEPRIVTKIDGPVNNPYCKMRPTKVVLGGIIDTYTDSSIWVDRPDYNVMKGEPLTVILENTSDSDVLEYLVYFVPSEETVDLDTKLTYQPSPFDSSILEFTTNNVTIPAQMIAHVPIRIIIPNVKNIPKRWEFDIVAYDVNGIASAAKCQRWLITMR